jgi:hypothetical protein
VRSPEPDDGRRGRSETSKSESASDGARARARESDVAGEGICDLGFGE